MESARIEMEQYDIETYYKYMYRNGDVNDIFSDCVSDLYDFAYTQRHTHTHNLYFTLLKNTFRYDISIPLSCYLV